MLGLDPGTANLGLAVLEYIPGTGKPRVLTAEHHTTKVNHDAVTVVEDDLVRLRALTDVVRNAIDVYKPDVIAAETYIVFSQHAVKTGWKVAYSYSMTAVLAHLHGIPFRPIRPQEIKRKVAHASGASKDDVARAVCGYVVGLEARLNAVPRNKREHISDACAIALLGLGYAVKGS